MKPFVNPLFESSLFVTPESFDELCNMIERNYNGSERAIAYQVMMFTQNLCSRMVDKALVDS